MFSLEKNKEITRGNLVSWGMLVVLFLYMDALNFLMPLHRDDYEYSLIWGTYQKITTMTDVFQSLYLHYFTHGGRMVDFFVLDSFLLWGKQWFNPFNAFLFTMLIVLIYWHSQQKITWRFNPYILALSILFCWFGLPDFAVVNIWMTGACVYLLTAVLIFSFLLPYHFDFLGKPLLRDSYLTALGMFLGGIIASWTIENTAATMNLLIVGFIVYAYKKQSLKKWMLSGFCGSIIGFSFLVLAPGNYVRYASQNTPFMDHLFNQLGAGIEISLGLLPAIIFLVLAWRILLTEHAKGKKLYFLNGQSNKLNGFVVSSIVRIAVILTMLLSRMNGSFFSQWISKLLYENVAVRFGLANSHLKFQLFNALSGLEEVIIYLLLITQVSKYAFRKWQLRKTDIEDVVSKVNWWELMAAHPTCYHIAILIILAIINNLAMIASPTFPGRAGFGSAVFFIIGAMSVFAIPKVKYFLLSPSSKKYLAIVAGIGIIPMAVAVLHQHTILYIENSQRMAYVEEMAKQGATSLELEPLPLKNLVLRHVYFVELDNYVSKYGFCRYYDFKDITVKSHDQPIGQKATNE